MPIQLPDDSLLTFHPPSAGIPCGTDDHNDKFPTFGFHILSPGTPTFYGGYGSLNQHRNIVARTSHTSGLEELQEGYPQVSVSSDLGRAGGGRCKVGEEKLANPTACGLFSLRVSLIRAGRVA